MSDSSSEDEISKELLESVDKSLMNNSLFSSGGSDKHNNKKSESSNEKILSLRKISDEDDQFTQTGLSKSKQIFIAKRLSQVLDREIEEVNRIRKHKKYSEKDKEISGGVNLFSDSVEYLDHNVVDDNYVNIPKRPSNYSYTKVDECEVENRCKEVAVSADWILSGASTKGWSHDVKGKVIRLKQKKTSISSNVIECEVIK